jgi:histidine triad (HIT) family protein
MSQKVYDDNNVFAKILRKEIPADVIYEDNNVLAFRDVAPAAPTHILVIPKTAYVSFSDFASKAGADDVGNFFKVVNDIAERLALGNGFRIISNIGFDGSQTVEHFHVHILGGKQLGGLVPSDHLTR